ncbi:MAG: DUF3108 domain-containing protein [Burkholderiales bacterium]
MSTTAAAPTILAISLRLAQSRAMARTRRALAIALVLSVALHLALTLWPTEAPLTPESTPLTATITELPPPPVPAAVPPPKPAAKPKARKTSPLVPPTPEAQVADDAAAQPAPAEPAAKSEPETTEANEPRPEVVPGAIATGKTLPPRVDLAYKVFWGTRGFLIGDAVYRFEHKDNRYRIATVGEARGLAALVLRGQGKLESRGLITEEGLQPLLLRIERGGPDRVETAAFDWESGIVTMHDGKTASLDLPTFDPLSLMWQYYFTPPQSDEVTVTVATPRRLVRYTITREGSETIERPSGPIAAERWHRRSEDGKTDAYIWVAPSLRYVPVKIRVSNTERGTLEVVLDSIRVDEDPASAGRDDALVVPRSDPGPPPDSPIAAPRPAETFPTMTGQ